MDEPEAVEEEPVAAEAEAMSRHASEAVSVPTGDAESEAADAADAELAPPEADPPVSLADLELDIDAAEEVGEDPAATESESLDVDVDVDVADVLPDAPTSPAHVAFSLASYGAGSAVPAEDGSGPQGWSVKGNEDSMLFHTPESPHYERTGAEVWFIDEATAAQATIGGRAPTARAWISCQMRRR